ncbi:hypothetical protein BD779DRAFT_1432207 [Infundibulicybe gibba]|nr:hypothetical protein BD779DRAFT_1432207 [Infundibulicybe gibba]
MPTSELSDALNPYATQTRPRTQHIDYSTPAQPPPQQIQAQHVPHRSELELAISEPPPPPPPPPRRNRTTQPGPRTGQPSSVQAVQELFRIVSANREAHEIERKRRLAWEQEQEAKYTQRQAETERRMFEMRQEIASLRSVVANLSTSSGLLTPQYQSSPAIPQQLPRQLISPVSPAPHPSSYTQPTFVQGSSSQPMMNTFNPYQDNNSDHFMQVGTPISNPPSSMTPAPSPQPNSVPTSEQTSSTTPSTNPKKRRAYTISSDEEEDTDSSDSSELRAKRPNQRVNHHDKRCLTINNAFRKHLLYVMDLDNDKNLPDSHIEGQPLGKDDPVRFVWDKTTKQSVHNARMKERVIADLKARRKKYKYVPERDFNKKSLDGAFEQSFITLRQKFKAQRDSLAAMSHRRREDQKAQKARHLSRRKIKLNNRADARLKIEVFEHSIFGGALQLECMSSEESDFELDTSSATHSSGVLRTRGYSWRSTRLMRFYCILDDEERAENSSKPKRGIGRKERCMGPPKEGFHLPPSGVASWMVSKSWIHTAQSTYPDLPDMLEKLVVDPPGFDWEHFTSLGEESDSPDGQPQTVMVSTSQPYTSLLNFALV